MELPPGVEFVRAKRQGWTQGLVRDIPLFAVMLVGMGIGSYAMQRFTQLMSDGGARGTWFAVGGLFTVSTLLVSAAPVFSFRRLFRDRHARLAAATEVSGEVVGIDANGVPGEEGYLEIPVVRFTTPEGRVLQGQPVFEQLTPKGLTEGDTVRLRYDPADPGWLVIGELDYGNTRLIKWGIGVFVACWLILPLAFCIYKGLTAADLAAAPPVAVEPRDASRASDTSASGLWLGVLLFGGFAAALAWDGRRKYARWLERFGRSHEVTATIIDINLNVGGPIRNAQPVYHFKGLDGKERTAPSAHRHVGWRPGKLFTVGSSARVRYDPDEPQWVVGSEVTEKNVRRRHFGGAAGFGVVALLYVAAAIWL